MNALQQIYKYGLFKKCSTCKKYKLRTNFSKLNKAKDGKQSYCKMCRHDYYVRSKKAKATHYQKTFTDHIAGL